MSAFVSVAIKLVGVSSPLGLVPVARTGLVWRHGGVLEMVGTCHGGHHFFAPLFYIIIQAHTYKRARTNDCLTLSRALRAFCVDSDYCCMLYLVYNFDLRSHEGLLLRACFLIEGSIRATCCALRPW